MTPLLLDTCAAIWLAEDEPIAAAAAEALDAAARSGTSVFVSAMTAWEIGLLVAKQKIVLSMSPEAWFRCLLGVPGVALAAITVEALIASSFLPGTPPRDPADRIIAATARACGYRLVTRDRQLLAYAEQGHLAALAC
ncbi:MAG: type II toxin-antitoxin system VapC family toxin [Deltaproteobacteria bacterium]|nr:type II toxin-antitoxin system VapC family toxin [Deltaproteobacteria bacterium]